MKKNVTYSYIKFLRSDAEDAISLISYDFVTSKEVNNKENSIILNKENSWLDNRIVLNYNFFKNNSEDFIKKKLDKKNIKLFIYEVKEKSGSIIKLREVTNPFH